ncbi:hypothetical protein ABID99_000732 [Mucilaginibacter sp. OAE612]
MKTTNLNELLNSNVIALDDQAQNNIIGGLRTVIIPYRFDFFQLTLITDFPTMCALGASA